MTGHLRESDNPVARQLHGIVNLEYAGSLLQFDHGNMTQKMLHQLKYKGATSLGEELGKMVGLELRESNLVRPDVIVPVPLHRKKHRKRGYNQALHIAKGVGSVLGIPVQIDMLIRTEDGESQTTLSRFDRWQGVHNAFEVSDHEPDGKHVLIVDDVVTTGSTIEACARPILARPHTKVSAVTVACA